MVAALRAGFTATMRDPALVEEARTSGLDIDPTVAVGATTPGALANNSNLVVDATPRVRTVGSGTPDGVYGPGIVIPIQVTFSSAVDVNTAGGTPTLALDTGAVAAYTGGTGTATLLWEGRVRVAHRCAPEAAGEEEVGRAIRRVGRGPCADLEEAA